MKVNLGFASLLAVTGIPMPRRAALNAAGVRHFGLGWRGRIPGSREDLVARFALLDPGVTLEFHPEAGTVWPVALPEGQAALGCRPRRRRIRVQAHWKDRSLPGRFPELSDWCRTVALDWLPTDYDELHLVHHWHGGVAALAPSNAVADPDPIALPISGAGSRAVVAIEGEPRLVQAEQLIVGDLARGHFLINTQPFAPAWRAEECTWTALRPTDRLHVATSEAGRLDWYIDGLPVRPSWSRYGMACLPLPEPVAARQKRKIEAFNSSGESIRILPNPAAMRVVDHDPRSGTHRPSVSTEAIPARTCETLLNGAVGLHTAVQLMAAVPTTDLIHESLLRHGDIRRRLAADLPDLRLIAVENGVAPADLRFRRRLRIVIDPPKDSPAAPSAWQNAVRVLLTPRISEPRSLEISLLEESP